MAENNDNMPGKVPSESQQNVVVYRVLAVMFSGMLLGTREDKGPSRLKMHMKVRNDDAYIEGIALYYILLRCTIYGYVLCSLLFQHQNHRQ